MSTGCSGRVVEETEKDGRWLESLVTESLDMVPGPGTQPILTP